MLWQKDRIWETELVQVKYKILELQKPWQRELTTDVHQIVEQGCRIIRLSNL